MPYSGGGGGGGGGAVTSVAGKIGVVTLVSGDIGGLGTAAVLNATAFCQVTNNLSDLANATTARTNLGLGSAAQSNTSAFDAAGLAATVNSTLSTHTALTFSAHGGTINATLTSYASGAGTVSAADTIIGAIQKLDGNIAGKVPTTVTVNGHALSGNISVVYADLVPSTTFANTSATTVTFDPANGLVQSFLCPAGNVTVTLTAPSGSKPTKFLVKMKQDTNGSRIITWPSAIAPGGNKPVITPTANAVDWIMFEYDDMNSKYVISTLYVDVK